MQIRDYAILDTKIRWFGKFNMTSYHAPFVVLEVVFEARPKAWRDRRI